MTVIKHQPVQKMAEAFDTLLQDSEGYKAFLSEKLARYQSQTATDARLPSLVQRQVQRVDRFLNLLQDSVLEQLMEMVNRIEGIVRAEQDAS
ncbi:MAG: hypothetical protein ACE5IG_07090 [Dehalococcoidia bacterium]